MKKVNTLKNLHLIYWHGFLDAGRLLFTAIFLS